MTKHTFFFFLFFIDFSRHISPLINSHRIYLKRQSSRKACVASVAYVLIIFLFFLSMNTNFWGIVVQVYNEFSLQSTVHGIKYTTQAKTTLGRCLWVSIVSLSIVASFILANKFYERHEAANMRTLVISNQYPSWMYNLPAITICHSDVASFRRVTAALEKKQLSIPHGTTFQEFSDSLKYISLALFPSKKFEKQLSILDKILKLNGLSLEELFKLVGPSCSDYIAMCRFEGKLENCNGSISPSVTPYGFCCSFNYARNSNENGWNISIDDKYSANFGARFILSVLMKSFEPNDRVSSMMYGDGVKVMIHDRYTYPGVTALEFVAPSGHETVARLYGKRLTVSREVLKLGRKYSGCQHDSQDDSNEYRADNCYTECREKVYLRECGCLPFFSSKINVNHTICNISDVSCLDGAKANFYYLTLRMRACKCLPDCESTTFSLATTSLPFNAPQFNPSKFYKKAIDMRNPTAIHITYSEQSGMLMRRELVLSWINVVSSLGGVFSLFLGCSFISIIEIIYFFFIRLVWKLMGRRLATRTAA